MKKILTIIVLCLSICKIQAQKFNFEYTDTTIFQSFEAKLAGTVTVPDIRLNEKCTTKDWCPSDITLYNGEVIKNKNLKYNGFDNSFIWIEPETYAQVRLDNELIKEVKMKVGPTTVMVYKPFQLKQVMPLNSKNVFINVLEEGKISLYVYRQFILYNLNKYEANYHYIIKKRNGKMEIFKPGKRALLSNLSEHKKELRKIISKNHLKPRREDDLIKAVKLLNLEI